MKITRTSILTHVERSREIDISPEELEQINKKSLLIQNIVPHLSPDDREFLINGIVDEDFDMIRQSNLKNKR